MPRVFEYKFLIFGFSLLCNRKQKLKWFILFSFPFANHLTSFYIKRTLVDERLKVHSKNLKKALINDRSRVSKVS